MQRVVPQAHTLSTAISEAPLPPNLKQALIDNKQLIRHCTNHNSKPAYLNKISVHYHMLSRNFLAFPVQFFL